MTAEDKVTVIINLSDDVKTLLKDMHFTDTFPEEAKAIAFYEDGNGGVLGPRYGCFRHRDGVQDAPDNSVEVEYRRVVHGSNPTQGLEFYSRRYIYTRVSENL